MAHIDSYDRFAGLTSVVTVQWIFISSGLSALIAYFRYYPARRGLVSIPLRLSDTNRSGAAPAKNGSIHVNSRRMNS